MTSDVLNAIQQTSSAVDDKHLGPCLIYMYIGDVAASVMPNSIQNVQYHFKDCVQCSCVKNIIMNPPGCSSIFKNVHCSCVKNIIMNPPGCSSIFKNVVKVVGCVPINISCTHLSQPVGSLHVATTILRM